MYVTTCTCMYTLHVHYMPILTDVPAIPGDIQITSVGTCHFQLTWVISDPAPSTAPTDEVLLEQRACLYNDMSCDQEWEVLTMHSFDEQHCNVSVLPNEDYSFRVTSCNNLVGCSDPEVIQQGVNSRVQGTCYMYMYNNYEYVMCVHVYVMGVCTVYMYLMCLMYNIIHVHVLYCTVHVQYIVYIVRVVQMYM